MLANPRRCQYCEGAGTMAKFELPHDSTAIVSDVQCFNCNGSGVVCKLCGKPEGVCECKGEMEKQERTEA